MEKKEDTVENAKEAMLAEAASAAKNGEESVKKDRSENAVTGDPGSGLPEKEEVTTGTPERGQKSKKAAGGGILLWIRDLAIAAVIALVITQFVSPTIVQEHSMDDTLHNNDYLIMWKLPFKMNHAPEYGDIVIFKSSLLTEDGKQKLLIKRVIGKGGDTLAIRDGIVYRNGEALDETYTKDGYTNGEMEEITIPDHELFLMGDNRLVSVDSRSPQVGLVNEDLLVGKAVFRLFPFNKIGRLSLE